MTCTSIQETIYLGDKPIMGTPEDPDESYGSNYTGALRFSKMKTDIRLYTLL